MITEKNLIQVLFILFCSVVGGFTTIIGLALAYYKLQWFITSDIEAKYLYAFNLHTYKGFNRYILVNKLLPSFKFHFLTIISIILWVLFLTIWVSQNLFR
ncbi:MAG: hypothetical protein ACFE95_11950 [Candidatus Hodarchaeota archaeon]